MDEERECQKCRWLRGEVCTRQPPAVNVALLLSTGVVEWGQGLRMVPVSAYPIPQYICHHYEEVS